MTDTRLPADRWGGAWITHPTWAEHERRVLAAPKGVQPTPPAALPVVSRRVLVARTVARARWWVTGLGTYRATVDGKQVDEAVLEPGYSNIANRIAARCLDVTRLLKPGWVELAAEMGTGVSWLVNAPGRYAKFEARTAIPRFLGRLEIAYADGRLQVVVTDGRWSARLGATTTAHWHGGEDVDIRRTHAASPSESAAVLGAACDGPAIWWRRGEPVVVTEQLPVHGSHPIAVPGSEGDNAAVVLDAGLNFAGRYVLRLRKTSPGQRIVLRPAELLTPAGHVDQFSTGSPIWDSVTCDGGPLSWRPVHVYHGFRYLQIEGLTAAQRAAVNNSVTFEVLRAGVRPVGTFQCSDPMLQQLASMVDRAVQSNMYSVFTDCPHREKLGWLEQIDLCFDTLARTYDVVDLLRDTLVHIRDAQEQSGLVPSIAPELVRFTDAATDASTEFRDDVNWGSVIVHLPWHLYRETGDAAELNLSWRAILRYLGYLAARADADGLLHHGLGDWVAVDESTPRALVATCGYLRAVRVASRIAGVLGEQGHAAALAGLAGRLQVTIRRVFRDPDTGRWGSGSQGSWALALDSGAAAGQDRRPAARGLLTALAAAKTTLTVGEITLPPTLRALAALGRHDVIAALVRTTDGPGYATQIAAGATALNESLLPPLPDGPSSQNHFMLGAINSWLTDHVGGLAQAPGSTGWRTALITPARVPDVSWAHTTYQSPAGRYAVRWDTAGIDVTVPERGTATVTLPYSPGATGRAHAARHRQFGPGQWHLSWDLAQAAR